MTIRRSLGSLIYAAILTLAGSQTLYAQTPDEPVIDEGGFALVPSENPDIEHGKASVVEGEAGIKGDKFFIEYLNVTQPVSVILMAQNPAEPLTLNLSKYRYDQSDRFGKTRADGTVAFHFRTQGELKIHVKPEKEAADARAKYYLIAWVGDDIGPEDLPVPVTMMSESKGKAKGELPLGWLAALILSVGITVIIMRRRKT